MARVWYHIDPTTGTWGVWAAGTLPSAESVFRFEFLNQFIGWMRYVGNFAYDGDYHVPAYLAPTTMPYFASKVAGRSAEKFLLPGDDLKDLALWNSIGQFDPTSGMTLTDNAWKHFTDDFIGTLGTEEVEEPLEDNGDYATAAPLDVLTDGDIVQFSRAGDCPIRMALLNARTRLDMCRFAKVPWQSATVEIGHYGWTNGGGGVSITWPTNIYATDAHVQRYIGGGWTLESYGYVTSLRAKRTTSLFSDAPHSVAHAANYDQFEGGGGNWSGDDLSAWRPSDGKIKSIYLFDDPEDGEDAATTWGPTSLPSGTGWGGAKLESVYAYPLDALPDDFKPAAGFPWET